MRKFLSQGLLRHAGHMRKLCAQAILTTGLGLALGSAQAAVVMPTVGVYDPAGDLNDVDQNAAFLSGLGGATAANLTTLASFKPAVLAAFNANLGGVVNFNDGSTAQAGSFETSTTPVPFTGQIRNQIRASYGVSQANEILFIRPTDGDKRFAGTTFGNGTLQDRVPISGSASPGDGANQGGVSGIAGGFSLGTITPPSGYLVSQLAVAILDRAGNSFSLLGVATFSDGSSVSAAATTVGDSLANQDTFFGFVAPAGEGIVSVAIHHTENGVPTLETFQAFDDLGFILTEIPEPAAGSLLILAGLLMRRRA